MVHYSGEHVVKKWSLLALVILQGCQGGQHKSDAINAVDRHSHDTPLQLNGDPGSKQELQARVSFARLRLDVLQLQGADHCIPDQVQKVSLLVDRAQATLDDEQLYNAKKELQSTYWELDRLRGRLFYVRKHVSCSKPQSNPLFANGFDFYPEEASPSRTMDVSFSSSNRIEDLFECNAQFDFDSALLTPAYEKRLHDVARVLSPNRALSVRIAGHADSMGSESYNVALAEKRAKSVRDTLMRRGVDRQAISIVSFGESQPLSSNATPEGRLSNRRVEISVLDSSTKDYPAKVSDERLNLLWQWQPSSRVERKSE